MTDKVIAGVNALEHDQPQLVTFFDQNQCEIGNKDATEQEDNLAEKMPGVVGTNLQMNDNMEKIEEENIKITGVDPVEMEDYQKNDVDTDLPTSQPTTKPNDEELTY